MNDDTNLIDISMLQQLQDQFCCADHLYLMCVDKCCDKTVWNRRTGGVFTDTGR